MYGRQPETLRVAPASRGFNSASRRIVPQEHKNAHTAKIGRKAVRPSAFIRFRSVTGGRTSAYFRVRSFAFVRMHPPSFAFIRIQFFYLCMKLRVEELGNFCRAAANCGARRNASRQIHRNTSHWQAYSTAIRRNTSQKKYISARSGVWDGQGPGMARNLSNNPRLYMGAWLT